MAFFLGSLFFAIAFVASLVLFQIRRRKTRRQMLEGLELRPNCLLTRYPIAFLAGPKSVFRLFDHWNEVPAYLREHGYEVFVIEPNKTSPVSSVRAAIEALSGKCHIIADSSSADLLEEIARQTIANIASLTLVTQPSRNASGSTKAQRARATDLKPLQSAVEIFQINRVPFASDGMEKITLALLAAHNLFILGRARAVSALETAEVKTRAPWAIEARYLDLAISLAERDAQWPG